ncbi:RNA recognition motif domain-containing protein [Arachidicoccus sp.]|uniref:RNA recognition motif domain-containing protein n=1 Tax=Arachidicoccus sp. TaxID=1872624 RepID=UPI003D1A0C63
MNIYVGNLSWKLTSDDLHELFAPYGEVISAKVVTDKFNNNRSKGFGFVEMSDDEAANAAISGLHETEVDGRKIVVNQKQENAGGEYKKKSFGGGGGGYNRDRNSGGSGGYRNNY